MSSMAEQQAANVGAQSSIQDQGNIPGKEGRKGIFQDVLKNLYIDKDPIEEITSLEPDSTGDKIVLVDAICIRQSFGK